MWWQSPMNREISYKFLRHSSSRSLSFRYFRCVIFPIVGCSVHSRFIPSMKFCNTRRQSRKFAWNVWKQFSFLFFRCWNLLIVLYSPKLALTEPAHPGWVSDGVRILLTCASYFLPNCRSCVSMGGWVQSFLLGRALNEWVQGITGVKRGCTFSERDWGLVSVWSQSISEVKDQNNLAQDVRMSVRSAFL